MFAQITTILLFSSFQYIIVAENSTTSALSPFLGNTTTIRETQPPEVQNGLNFVTENLLIPSDVTDQQPTNIEPLKHDYNLLRARGKTKFILQNIAHSSNNRNERKIQEQNSYDLDDPLDDQQEQDLQLATVEKEEFIQSELHNLAKDIAETELNIKARNTNANPRPSSWKSFFSSIFPQGILNVFHLSVSTEPKKKEIPTVESYRNFNPIYSNRNKRVLVESKLTITSSIAPATSTSPPLISTETSTSTTQTVSQTAVTYTEAPEIVIPATPANNQEVKNGSVMTNKDVFDINSAAEVSEIPMEPIIPMESENIFHFHSPNCGNKCNDDYLDEPSDSGDDNVVAFSRDSPKNIFYPTQEPIPYGNSKSNRNSDSYYSDTQTSEEIVQENMKNFGQRLPVHPAKQLDEFQQEVEKQFDRNEVIIDSEAASRKFLKNFKGKYVKPPQSEAKVNTFKGPNHFQLISSTAEPEVKVQSQPNPVKAESKLHTQIYSADINSDAPPNVEEQIIQEKPSANENLIFQYPEEKPENLPSAYNEVTVSELPVPYKNSDTKDIPEPRPNDIKQGSHLYTRIYSAGTPDDEHEVNNEEESEQNIQPEIKDEKFSHSEELKGAYSTNVRPGPLFHTYIISMPPKNDIPYPNYGPGGIPNPERNYPPWITPKPEESVKPFQPTQTTYLCSNDQLKNGDCSYSTTPGPHAFNQRQNSIEIQKSLEREVKHTPPYIYYNFPPGPPALSQKPIKVVQQDDSVQSESFVVPESFEQHQKFLQDQQRELNQQQEYLQKQQIHENQLKLLHQQQGHFLQKQQEQMHKQQEILQQHYQKQQEQVQYYQQVQQQQLQNQHEDQQDRLNQFHKEQQQQREQQRFEQQKQYLHQYQQEQQTQRDQQQLMELQHEHSGHRQERQEEPPYHHKEVRYNTVKVEKIVPQPYPVPVQEIVEKIVERPVPVEKIVEKPVNVPFPVREVVEKIVDRPYPVEKIIDRPVHIPYPVQVDHFIDRPYPVRVPVAVPVPVHQYIDRPYPVEKIVEKPIHVPYPVDKIVEKIVEKHIPIEVERIVEVEKPATKKPPAKKPVSKPHPRASLTALANAQKAQHAQKVQNAQKAQHVQKAQKNNTIAHLDELLELVPPPLDDADHDAYRTINDDVEFVLLDDYNRPIPFEHQGFPWNSQEKRSTKNQNHNIKRSPEFRRNLRVEYGFRPPLIPSIEIGEKGLI